jgi:hypothetical protein
MPVKYFAPKVYHLKIVYQQPAIYPRGGSRGGRTRRAPPPPPPPPKIGKNMISWRKIVIFHTKYPKNFRASLRSAQFI